MADGKMMGWQVWNQYIRDSRGNVICQWGAYTGRRNAELIARAPAMAALLKAIERAHPALVGHAKASLTTFPAALR